MAQAGGAVAHAVSMQNRHDEIAHSCHGLRGGTTPNATGVLAKRDVSHVMQWFSIAQCARLKRSKSAGPARSGGKLLIL